jgi:hypothetical protein
MHIECPRCGHQVDETFWGPCAACRDELAATMSRAARDVEQSAYVPKMNVTPNAVAVKE